MSNFEVLTDAFAELERRADAASARLAAEPVVHTPVRQRHRLPLVAASVLGVVAIAAGAALLQRDPASHSAAGAPPVTVQSSAATTTFHLPRTPAELARRFRVVLGDTATFTVTDTGAAVTVTAPPAPSGTALPTPATPPVAEPNGAAIVGTLTAAGVTGGFDLQIFAVGPGEKAWCSDPDRSRCTVRRLADGSSLAVGREPLPGAPNAVTYEVNLIRTDGVEFLMHVSNERSPKGASAMLAAHPPLTTGQLTAIVTSDRW